MQVGIAAYSFPCSCGFARRDGEPASRQPLTAWDLIALASEHGLTSLEIPLQGMLPDLSERTIDQLRGEIESHDMTLVMDRGIVDVETLRTLFPLARRAGARVVRATLSSIL